MQTMSPEAPTLTPRWLPGDKPAGTRLVVQRVERMGNLFLYEVWCEKTHVLKSMTQGQIEALVPVTGTCSAG